MIDILGTEWITVAQAADRFTIRKSLLYGWAKRGLIRTFIDRGTVMMLLVPDVAEAEYEWRTRRKGHRRHAGAQVRACPASGE